MIVMPSNNTGKVVRDLFAKYPEKIALLISPEGFRPHQLQYAYAFDNGAYKNFNEIGFFKMLDASKKYTAPIFVVCPDVVGCHARTIALWQYYYTALKKYNYPLAFVAQNGCTPEMVPKNCDWIFIGGLDPWKMDNIHRFIGFGKPVHVGRVNSISRLKYCESLGVNSIDGTGWMRFRGKNFFDLLDWFTGDKKQLQLFEEIA